MFALLFLPVTECGRSGRGYPALHHCSASDRRRPMWEIYLLVFLAPLGAHAQTAVAAPSGQTSRVNGVTSAVSTQPTPTIRLTWQAGRLSLSAERAPLNLVLKRIASQTGAAINGGESFQQPVSIEVSGVSLKQGLQSLLSQADYVMEDVPGGSVRVVIFGLNASSGVGSALPASASNSRTLPTQAVSLSTKVHDGKGAESEGASNEQILRKSLSDPDPLVREAAREALLEENPTGELDEAASHAKSAGGQVRLDALRTVVQSSDTDDATLLSALTGALKDEDTAVRAFAVRSLGDRGGPEAMASLRDAFHSGDSTTKILVLESIGQNREARQFVQDSASDPDPEVQALALGLLDRAEPPVEQDTAPE